MRTGSPSKLFILCLSILSAVFSCNTELKQPEDPTAFIEVGEVNIEGGELAAEISAYDISTKRLFVSNNAVGNRIDIIDLSDPIDPKIVDYILLKPWPDEQLTINSLSVTDKKLAVAVSATNPQNPGMVFIFSTENFKIQEELQVGSMPDMITFSPNGKYLLTANEGEPDNSYTDDPEGSVSIINTSDFTVKTVGFEGFSSRQTALEEKGFRIFGPKASFAQDIEPEYIAVSKDSKFAWVTLQENNGIAKIDIQNNQLLDIFPLGFKDFRLSGNAIDVCDNDEINVKQWPINGMFQPDAVAVFEVENKEYLITANEGDSRYYDGFSETARVSELQLDSTSFPNASKIITCDSLGRLIVTKTLGDNDGDGDYDELYIFGTRSFSIWDANTGELVMDSKNQLEQDIINHSDFYDDNRSDDKGTEPEGIIIGYVGNTPVAFIALERANAIVTYDLTTPTQPQFLQALKTGIGPEGVLFISKKDSPNGKSLLIVSSEVDGIVKLYQPQ